TTDERFTSIDSVKITVLPVPEIEADNIVLCAGESSKLMVRCNESNVKYSWFPPQGLDRTDIADPVVFAQKPMTYTVTVTNAQGCSSIKTVQVNIQERERIRGELVSQKLAVEPDEPSALTLQLWSRITPFTSFKARIRYDKTVFQFNPSSDTLLLGTISTWQIRAIEEGPGELVLMAEGTTPVQNLIAGFELNTFLARQRDKEIRLLLEEVNGHNISEGDSCRDVVTRSTEIALEDICAGAIRFVRLGENVTNLYDVFPNPVTSSVLNISYSIGIPGNVSLKIYDSRGTPVITPVDHFAGEGEYNVSIGHNELGAGLYTCVLTTGQGLFTKSFLLLK
ncbi:MAG TPA: T9SS type A sorting domain-containing protein, partial [Patescibacteria group bacterium]|nr:T9SS type A sorting domain-containing protein [Patescibacteria group bacterium]